MADQPQAPVQVKPFPHFMTNEGAAFGPIDLGQYIESPNEAISGHLRFAASLSNGQGLPAGIICTESGLLSGISASNTAGEYDVILAAQNASGIPITSSFKFTIRPRIELEDPNFLSTLKTQVWKALGENLPIPEMADMLSQPITVIEIYYLLQRFAVLTIWDVYNLENPSEKVLLDLPDLNEHYQIYDRGSCLVAAPKDLFSHVRTLEDALQASRVLAREVYKRGWAIEFAGFNKMVRGAWVELQYLGDKHGKKLEILHYNPSPEDMKAYIVKDVLSGPAPG